MDNAGRDAVTRPAWRQNAGVSASARGYGHEHRVWRAAVLARDPICRGLDGVPCRKRATHADHIIPLAKGGARYDLANGQGLCAEHHQVKTQRDSQRPSALRPLRKHPGLI